MTATTTVDHVVATIRDVTIPDKRCCKTAQPVIKKGTSIALLQLRTGIDVNHFIEAMRDDFIGDGTNPIHPPTQAHEPMDLPQPDCPEFPQCVKLVVRRRANRWGFDIGEHVATIHIADGLTLNKVLALLHEKAARLKAA